MGKFIRNVVGVALGVLLAIGVYNTWHEVVRWWKRTRRGVDEY